MTSRRWSSGSKQFSNRIPTRLINSRLHLKGAGLADLRQVPGVGKDLAEKIYNALHG